jgi:prokaryotic ubiquitin-like protein Pup
MPEQKLKQHSKKDVEEDSVEPKHLESDTEDVDDLLAEIDSVLEENAEEFVNAYVQKGGE